MEKNIKVFVYGSLKQGFGNHDCLRDATFLGVAQLEGEYEMFDLGSYPGVSVVAGVTNQISGEVYAVDQDGLDVLDCLEGNGSYYTRVKVKTMGSIRVWVYLLPADEYADEVRIPAGDWLGHDCAAQANLI